MENKQSDNQNSISANIIGKIRTEELSMRSKKFFTLKIIVLVGVSLLVLIISIFLLTYVFFSIRVSGHNSLLFFGSRGIFLFVEMFPWTLFLVDMILIMSLEWLLRRFRFGYHRPVLYLLGGIFVLTALTSILIDRATSINDRMMDQAYQHRLIYPINDIYAQARRFPGIGSDICICRVISVASTTLIVEDMRGGTTTILTVLFPLNDDRATTTDLYPGETILIAGDHRDGVIQAFGFRKVSPVVAR